MSETTWEPTLEQLRECDYDCDASNVPLVVEVALPRAGGGLGPFASTSYHARACAAERQRGRRSSQ